MATAPTVISPTGFLPHLTLLRSLTSDDLITTLDKLREFYWPLPLVEKKSDAPIHDFEVPDSGYASAEDDDDDDDADDSRSDPFERDYAVKWVTGLIARGEAWAEDHESEVRREIIEDAARILSLLASNPQEEEDCAVTRSFDFPNGIHVELNDDPLSTSDHTSVGLQSWASSVHLAERMCAAPGDFRLRGRILELGAGTGLLSIATSKLVAADIVVATDYHPGVLANLQRNVETNDCDVLVRKFDWETPSYDAPLDGGFDVILAADVVYHVNHATWIRKCVERLLKKGGVFWLMVALRVTGRHEGLASTVDDVFPDVAEGLVIRDMTELQRRGGVGRADEGGYRLYEIRWKM